MIFFHVNMTSTVQLFVSMILECLLLDGRGRDTKRLFLATDLGSPSASVNLFAQEKVICINKPADWETVITCIISSFNTQFQNKHIQFQNLNSHIKFKQLLYSGHGLTITYKKYSS